MSTDSNRQQPCIHCGDCARVCPEALDPEALFLALVGDAWNGARQQHLDACTECHRCVEACPSHIPLVDWFRWGNAELRQHARADAARRRFLARNARLARERELRAARRATETEATVAVAQTISKSEVLAAIARGRAKRTRASASVAPPDSMATGFDRKP